MQAPPLWTPPGGTLAKLVSEAEVRAAQLLTSKSELERAAADAPAAPRLAAALRRSDVAVIAEVKRRSPSKGWINPDLSAADQARAYASGGAAAISVLTEPAHFAGSPEDLLAVRGAVGVAVLKKDFHVHPVQLLQARALGASAVLLIARALAPAALASMLATAAELGLESLVEIRDARELELALSLDAQIIGINNRDLETLQIHPGTSEELLDSIPEQRVAIAESGVASRADVERAGTAGANAVLVGSSISASSDPGAAVRALTGVPRGQRAH